MVEPATPRIIALVKSLRISTEETNVRETIASPVASSSTVEFVEHWVRHGWTIPRLVRAYGAMRRTGLLYIVFIAISVAVITGHLTTSQKMQPILTATSILATSMLIMSYANLAMLCWRIRKETLDARLWMAQIITKDIFDALWIPPLQPNYTKRLKEKYQMERNRRAVPPASG